MAPTILIADELSPALTALIDRWPTTSEPCPTVVVVGNYPCDLEDVADRMVAATIKNAEIVRAALVLDYPPMYGHHFPGLITPRIVDNAERSGANRFKQVNAVYFPACFLN